MKGFCPSLEDLRCPVAPRLTRLAFFLPSPFADHGVKCISFSDDELLLCTVGVDSDKKMIIWDLSNGYIVCNQKSNP